MAAAWERQGVKTCAHGSVSNARRKGRIDSRYLMLLPENLILWRSAPRRRARARRLTTRPSMPWGGAPMDSYRILLSPSNTWTKVLLTHGPDELLRAVLPPPSQVRHRRSATTFLEALALWLDTTLPVVLCVDARDPGSCLDLTDEMGVGIPSVFYRVEVLERASGRRRRGVRIRGVGDFRDLRQLRFWSQEREF